MKDRIGRRVSTERPTLVIKRSFKSKFISLLGFWPWVILLINDFLKLFDMSAVVCSDVVKNVKAALPVSDDIKHYVLCGAVALVDFLVFVLIALRRARMRTYVYVDTMVYIPGCNPRKNTRARSFVGVYQASVLPASGFFLFALIRKIRRGFRGYRDIVITCPGSQTDGTIILRGIADYKRTIAKLNTLRVSESTNVAYTQPTNSSRAD